MNVYVFIADSGGALDTTATRKALARADGDADALPVRPYLHFFTRTSPRTVGDNVIYYCKDTLSPSCVHMERRLYLRYDVGTGMLVGRLVPDPSSLRYALEIRVSRLILVVTICITEGPLPGNGIGVELRAFSVPVAV